MDLERKIITANGRSLVNTDPEGKVSSSGSSLLWDRGGLGLPVLDANSSLQPKV